MNNEPHVIVAAIDGSRLSDLVLDIASASAAARSDGALHIVHVVEPPAPGFSPLVTLAQLVQLGQMTLARAMARVGTSFHGHVESSLVVDLFARGVLQAAADSRAELIVIGSHGHDSSDPRKLGPVSRTVVGQAHCPVLVTRPLDYPSGPTSTRGPPRSS